LDADLGPLHLDADHNAFITDPRTSAINPPHANGISVGRRHAPLDQFAHKFSLRLSSTASRYTGQAPAGGSREVVEPGRPGSTTFGAVIS
jgi:hypothetical protein